MKAQEALKQSLDGWIWNQNGSPAYFAYGVFFWSDGQDSIDPEDVSRQIWYPVSPSVSKEEKPYPISRDEHCISEVEELRNKIEKLRQQAFVNSSQISNQRNLLQANENKFLELETETLRLENNLSAANKKLEEKSPLLTRNPMNNPPNSARHVAIWDKLELLGSGWSYLGTFNREWNYNFQIETNRLPFYYWTELPKVGE